MDSREIGRRVKSAREARRLEQATVADKSGLSRAYISRLEGGGIINPKLFDLAAVAEAIGVPLTALTEDAVIISPDDEAELQALLSDPEMTTEFAATYRDSRVERWSDADKKFVLNTLRAARELINQRYEDDEQHTEDG